VTDWEQGNDSNTYCLYIAHFSDDQGKFFKESLRKFKLGELYMLWGDDFRSILKIMFGVGVLIFTILYPLVFRDWIFDNIPRDWTINWFKSIVLVFSFAVAGLSGAVSLIRPFLRLNECERNDRFIKIIGLSLTVIGIMSTITIVFWNQYNNDRTWITASYLSSTQQEIEMQTIGAVMEESEVLGFHYRALFLKMLQWLFFPIALVLPMLFLTIRDFIQCTDIRASLVTSCLLIFAFINFGFALYG
jgi:hypothetical protein